MLVKIVIIVAICGFVSISSAYLASPAASAENLGAPLLFQPSQYSGAEASGRHVTYKYEGNLVSRKFHQPNCPYTLMMSRSRKVYLPTIKLARAQGYKACRFCLPAASRTVHAYLIKAPDAGEYENSNSDIHHDISR
mgnify:CR=1 FL=1